MNDNFSETSLLQHLENLAALLEIGVRYESLADEEIFIHSGGCKLSGRNLIIIDQHLPPVDRARILARELSGMTWKVFTSSPASGNSSSFRHCPARKTFPRDKREGLSPIG